MRIPLDAYQNKRNFDGYLILPKEFTNKDGKFIQLKRVGQVALYKRGFGYEVIIIQSQNPFEITPGVFTEKKEGWPSDNLWGVFGFSYMDLESAETKFNHLIIKKEEQSIQPINNDGLPVKRGRGRPRKVV